MKNNYMFLFLLLFACFLTNIFVHSQTRAYSEMECEPGDITLDFKALPYDNYEYSPLLTVSSQGASAFTITVTDITNGFAHVDSYMVKNNLSVYSFNIPYGNVVRVKVVASNSFGTKTKTFNISPVYHPTSNTTNNISSTAYSTNVKYELFSTNGILIKCADSKAEITGNLSSGLYILVEKKQNGNIVRTEKLLINQ